MRLSPPATGLQSILHHRYVVLDEGICEFAQPDVDDPRSLRQQPSDRLRGGMCVAYRRGTAVQDAQGMSYSGGVAGHDHGTGRSSVAVCTLNTCGSRSVPHTDATTATLCSVLRRRARPSATTGASTPADRGGLRSRVRHRARRQPSADWRSRRPRARCVPRGRAWDVGGPVCTRRRPGRSPRSHRHATGTRHRGSDPRRRSATRRSGTRPRPRMFPRRERLDRALVGPGRRDSSGTGPSANSTATRAASSSVWA